MSVIQSHSAASQLRRTAIILLSILANVCVFLPLAARQQGPTSPSADAAPQKATLGPPTIPIEEIIQKFAAREAEFKIERDNFTYTQSFLIQTLDVDGHPDGEYKRTSEVVFTPQGK